MKYLIVIDGTENGRPIRNYLCCPREFRGRSGAWTSQREEATEFASRKVAREIIQTKIKIKTGVRIVAVSEDPLSKQEPRAVRNQRRSSP
jgi:hypothetical protein